VFIENGRVLDTEDLQLKQALLEVAKTGKANFIFTCNQNLILGDIKPKHKAAINTILSRYKLLDHTNNASSIRKNAMACVALNTCPLALAEGQRYLPTLITKIEPILTAHGLQDEDIIIRMTGCPNGCARPFVAEIGFVGTALGKYNLHLGGDYLGMRLNRIYKESLDETSILNELDQLFGSFKSERINGEKFGDYTFRKFFN
jgi:sulfite reductase (NADPH) hemoprotein beta-component